MNNLTVFVSSFDEARVYRKYGAQKTESSLLGCRVVPLFAWLEEQWHLWGDTRTIISSVQRSVLVSRLLLRQNVFPYSKGSVNLFARYVYEVCGSPSLEKALANKDHYTQTTQNILQFIESYQSELQRCGFIESGHALSLLPRAIFAEPFLKAKGFDSPFFLDDFFKNNRFTLQDAFSSSGASVGEVARFRGEEIPEFLFSSGPSAQGGLLIERIKEWLSHNESFSIFIASNDALVLFDSLRGFFAEHSISAEVQGKTAFSNTFFGKSYLALANYNKTNSYDSLSDYLCNPFSGVSTFYYYQINTLLRGSKRYERSEIINMLRKYAPHFSYAEELFLDVDAGVVLDYFKEEVFELFPQDPARQQEELTAINALRVLYEAVRATNGSFDDISELIGTLSFDVCKAIDLNSPQVTIADYSQLRKLSTRSFDVVVMCDLDNNSFPSSIWYEAFLSVNEEMGFSFINRYLENNRVLINKAQEAARVRFVCEQTLMTENGQETYPVFFFDEFMEYYRTKDKNYQYSFCDLDMRTCTAFIRGEEALTENLLSNKTNKVSSEEANDCQMGSIAEFKRGLSGTVAQTKLIFQRKSKANGNYLETVSPSDIEAYLECPYRWFVERRLNPQPLDFRRGPLEQGSFVHQLFSDFYHDLNRKLGFSRVDEDNLSQAQELMSDLFDKLLLEQTEDDSVHYLLETKADFLEGEQLKEKLLQSLVFQSRMFEGYVPLVHEKSLTQECDVEYAGKNLVGRVDRIEVNKDTNSFMVVDYKGNISQFSAGYDPENKEELILPHKIQALIYAQALRKHMEGMKCQAALYLSYKAQQETDCLAGSCDSLLSESFWYIGRKNIVAMNFHVYLDLVEEALTPVINRLFEGDIDPHPRDASSCKYCPVSNCGRKL